MTLTIHQFFKKYKTDTTTDSQLLEWGEELGIKNLRYSMRDELQKLNRSTRFILMNFERSDQNGNHHCAIINDKQHPAYFDSYGGSPPVEVIKFMNTKGRGIYSDFQIQEMNSHYCGQVSLYVLYQNPDSYIDIILDLNQYING